jgi:GGDEF domain-containing protein
MDQLYVYATRDSLTGLLNRRALYEGVETDSTGNTELAD